MINNSGLIIGYASVDEDVFNVIWQNQKIYKIEDLFDSGDWTFEYVTGLNDKGEMTVTLSKDGRYRGAVLKPIATPEAPMLYSFFLGIGFWFLKKYRFK